MNETLRTGGRQPSQTTTPTAESGRAVAPRAPFGFVKAAESLRHVITGVQSGRAVGPLPATRASIETQPPIHPPRITAQAAYHAYSDPPRTRGESPFNPYTEPPRVIQQGTYHTYISPPGINDQMHSYVAPPSAASAGRQGTPEEVRFQAALHAKFKQMYPQSTDASPEVGARTARMDAMMHGAKIRNVHAELLKQPQFNKDEGIRQRREQAEDAVKGLGKGGFGGAERVAVPRAIQRRWVGPQLGYRSDESGQWEPLSDKVVRKRIDRDFPPGRLGRSDNIKDLRSAAMREVIFAREIEEYYDRNPAEKRYFVRAEGVRLGQGGEKPEVLYELCGKGTLGEGCQRLRQSVAHLPKEQRVDVCRYVIKELVSAARQLRDMGLVHNDFQPENIGFDEEGNVKIFDYGLVRYAHHDGVSENDPLLPLYQCSVFNIRYYPGGKEEDLSTANWKDLFAIGKLAQELVEGILAPSSPPPVHAQREGGWNPKASAEYGPDYKSFVETLLDLTHLTESGKQPPKFEDILDHPFLKAESSSDEGCRALILQSIGSEDGVSEMESPQGYRNIPIDRVGDEVQPTSGYANVGDRVQSHGSPKPQKPLPAEEIAQRVGRLEITSVTRNAGIANAGSSCYLGSGLNLLASCAAYLNLFSPGQDERLQAHRQAIINNPDYPGITADNFDSVLQLRQKVGQLLEKIRTGQPVLAPEIQSLRATMNTLGLLPPQGDRPPERAQQDPNEVIFRKLIPLIDVERSLAVTEIITTDFQNVETELVRDNIPAFLPELNPDNQSQRQQSGWVINLPIQAKSTLQDALQAYRDRERLQGVIALRGDEVIRGDPYRSIQLSGAPPVLTIALKRTAGLNKDHHPVEIPDELQVAGASYRLKAVVYHHGVELNVGHYTAMTRNEAGTWSDIDDNTVSKLSGMEDPNNALKKNTGYLYTYERV